MQKQEVERETFSQRITRFATARTKGLSRKLAETNS